MKDVLVGFVAAWAFWLVAAGGIWLAVSRLKLSVNLNTWAGAALAAATLFIAVAILDKKGYLP